jgi:hypothetical protein
MRAIRRFPPPDSHVSLSAVLAPCPDAQPALPPQPALATKRLTPKPRSAATEPTLTDTPRHHNPPRLRTGPLTWLPDCCATQTGASLRPGAQSLNPSPASTTNLHRQSTKTRDLHATKTHNRRHRQHPLPANKRPCASASSFRPKLQPTRSTLGHWNR